MNIKNLNLTNCQVTTGSRDELVAEIARLKAEILRLQEEKDDLRQQNDATKQQEVMMAEYGRRQRRG